MYCSELSLVTIWFHGLDWIGLDCNWIRLASWWPFSDEENWPYSSEPETNWSMINTQTERPLTKVSNDLETRNAQTDVGTFKAKHLEISIIFFCWPNPARFKKKKKNFWNIGQLISSRRHSSRNYWIGIIPRHYRVILITQNVKQSLSFKSAGDWLEMACHVKNTLG